MLLVLMVVTGLIQTTLPGTGNAAVPPVRGAPTVVRAEANTGNTSVDAPRAQPATVCRMEPITGTRFPVRVCRTPRHSTDDRDEGREMLRRIQSLPDNQSSGL